MLGIITGSLALIADATHNLTDNFTLGVSFAANRIARRDANDSKSFGYGRATILAALLNASFMIAIAIFVSQSRSHEGTTHIQIVSVSR